jgi:hypothetical protein
MIEKNVFELDFVFGISLLNESKKSLMLFFVIQNQKLPR